MVLYFDVTKSAAARQLSGLIRVSEKLRHALSSKLGKSFVPVIWNNKRRNFSAINSKSPVEMSSSDRFVTPEIFSSDDRPGYFEYLMTAGVRNAAIFHDAIPLKHPDIVWPKSVARHPQYMKDLVNFSDVFCVSEASQKDLQNYWKWLDYDDQPSVKTLRLGADFFDRSEKAWTHLPLSPPLLLNVGIIEPRKSQSQVLDVACQLWDAGMQFELHFVGRVNPHFGRPIEKRIRKKRKDGYPVRLHSKQNDDLLLDLYSKAKFTIFNSIAEGFGLPVVESLWLGIPCISNDLPSLTPILSGPSCQFIVDAQGLKDAMQVWLEDINQLKQATQHARGLKLPLWADTAQTLIHWAKQE